MIFTSYDFSNQSTDGLEFETSEDIQATIESDLSHADEAAELELEEKLEGATYPRWGFTTGDKIENEDQYRAWLEEVMKEEREEARATLESHYDELIIS